jgi:lactoylglutathione lyase
LGVQQIAIGAVERASLHCLWYDILGLQPSERNIEMPSENVCEDIVRLGGTGPETAIEIDLMTPIDPEKSPHVHIPPLNHLGLWVDDLPRAVDWMTQQGVRFTPGGIRPGAAGYNVIFIHPKGNEAAPIGGNGVLIELVQAPPNVVRALSCMPSSTKEPIFY